MTQGDVTRSQDMIRSEQLKVRVLFIGGALTAALAVVALAAGDLGSGAAALAIGLGAFVVGMQRAQNPKPWYTAGSGFALMGGGAAFTNVARNASGRSAQIVQFLLAGLLLWAGLTCLIAAAVATRRPVPSPNKHPNKPRRSRRQSY